MHVYILHRYTQIPTHTDTDTRQELTDLNSYV